ncbi:hypothetical protein NGRA_1555 [Nosema granulosis]|uniref:Uncharacterized protein n=1 Tax=Nosema granulosis TaxID=83296 RepID=A0A9P6GYQ1_9MICR|nr:hypothetical protein NGRA_1555 [Nosema granulosis]
MIQFFLFYYSVQCAIGRLHFGNIEIAQLSKEIVKNSFKKIFKTERILVTKKRIEIFDTRYFVSVYKDHHIIVKVVGKKQALEIGSPENEPEEYYCFPKSKNFDNFGIAPITNLNYQEIIANIMKKINIYTITPNANIYFTFSGSQFDEFFNLSNLANKIEIFKRLFEIHTFDKYKATFFPSDLEDYLSEKLYRTQHTEDVISLNVDIYRVFSYISKKFYESLYYDCIDQMKNFDLRIMARLSADYLSFQASLPNDRVNLFFMSVSIDLVRYETITEEMSNENLYLLIDLINFLCNKIQFKEEFTFFMNQLGVEDAKKFSIEYDRFVKKNEWNLEENGICLKIIDGDISILTEALYTFMTSISLLDKESLTGINTILIFILKFLTKDFERLTKLVFSPDLRTIFNDIDLKFQQRERVYQSCFRWAQAFIDYLKIGNKATLKNEEFDLLENELLEIVQRNICPLKVIYSTFAEDFERFFERGSFGFH